MVNNRRHSAEGNFLTLGEECWLWGYNESTLYQIKKKIRNW